MTEKKGSLLPGIVFIIVGLWLFARRFHFFSPHSYRIYPILLICFALFLFFETIRRRHSGALFWGVVMLVVGGFYFLRNFEIIPHFYIDEYWPIFLLALGLGFITLFIYHPRDWGVLIPGVLFLFFGMGFSLRSIDEFFWRWEHILENYWPIILIVIGLGVFMSGLQRNPKELD